MSDIPEELVNQLLDKGSVPAFAKQVGDEVAVRVMHELVSRAPEEIQPIWPYVIAWGRTQQAYETAARRGDTDEMLKCARASAQLLRDVY